ncbi:FixH family protein [Daejeonella sp. H1SJ63]|jgi:hypothetical protein|uniref:FixH family protein n=1 Tax=Daejeonella sp. H1SJ63 TaxID=3034145 RepID=UPI0023EC26D2|nr:FixH family protein [Daejeonella sp. H1SJ63]
MNWGTKLVLGMVTFMTFIITLVVLMMRSDSDDLVDQNYYQKGIEYDKDYIRKSRVNVDKAEPEISVGQSLKITFKNPAKGNIRFLHPSDQTKDRVVSMDSGMGNTADIPLNEFTGGHWKVMLEWESSGKGYMFEKDIIIR